MFDISFSELLLIAVVALLVIGPEKLPKVARTAGAFTGRLQRFMAQVKDEVNREARFEELQKLQQEVKDGVNKVESSIRTEVSEVKSVANNEATEIAEPSVKKATRRSIKPKVSVDKSPVAKKASATRPRATATSKDKAVKKVAD
ncbi:MAG: Sec-independent protein translocase protein TatB [Methylophilus sp.]